jgi:hypothetical protein
VAIGLALITTRILPQYGEVIRAIILGATFIYELVGPAITKASLQKAERLQNNYKNTKVRFFYQLNSNP